MSKNFVLSHNKDKYRNPILFHSHDFYEIYFFVDGDVRYYVENDDYDLKKGDVLLIPPGKLHRPVIDDNSIYERYVLWILDPFIENNSGICRLIDEINQLAKEKNTHLVSMGDEEQRYLKYMLDKTLQDISIDGNTEEYISESCIMLILDELRHKFRNTIKTENEQGDIIRQVIVYLNRNYTKNPSLDELSEVFFVSKYYLLHKFKEYTKTTIHNYILMKKINLAKELLKKEMPPQMVCEKCGFSTYSNFYKAFIERTGISPGKYRKI